MRPAAGNHDRRPARGFDRHARAAHYLALLAQPGIGPATVRTLTSLAGGLESLVSTTWSRERLHERFSSPDAQLSAAARNLLPDLSARLGAALPAARRTVNDALGSGLTVITVDDDDYPPALTVGLSGPPVVLFVEGSLPRTLANGYETLPAGAVVGTRRASRFSLTFAADLAGGLARLGAVVVSGLALGIDAAAHVGAMEGAQQSPELGGGTVAVLGGGHGRFHPPANRSLAAAIVGSGGAVISEWPPDVNPAPHQFLHRNRIISGLTRAVVIVEAGERSGAVNTASHALSQGRDVLVVPGRPGPAMAGSLALLRDGANLLEGLADLAKSFATVPGLGPALGRLVLEEPRPARGERRSGPSTTAKDRAPSKGPVHGHQTPAEGYALASQTADGPALGHQAPNAPGASPPYLEPLTARVLAALQRSSEATIDDLLAALGGPDGSAAKGGAGPTTAAVTASLIELELSGAVVRSGDARYAARPSPTRLIRAARKTREGA